jgi:replication-associated recombination protein RarA
MDMICQRSSLEELRHLATGNIHSVLISGCSGCGKTYLAAQYAKMLNIQDFQVVKPAVAELRDCIDVCSTSSSLVVLCIENLDTGVIAAAYTLLKFLEEPRSNVYIVVTCRNLQRVPDTIVSRSSCIETSPPTVSDLQNYARSKNLEAYELRANSQCWNYVRTIHDVDSVLQMSLDHLQYVESISSKLLTHEPVSSLSWYLTKFPDGSAAPTELLLRSLLDQHKSNSYIQKCGVACIDDLLSGRMSANAVISKFLFEYKYGG